MIDTLYILLSLSDILGKGRDLDGVSRIVVLVIGMAGQIDEGLIMSGFIMLYCIDWQFNEYDYGGVFDYITGLSLTNHTKILITPENINRVHFRHKSTNNPVPILTGSSLCPSRIFFRINKIIFSFVSFSIRPHPAHIKAISKHPRPCISVPPTFPFHPCCNIFIMFSLSQSNQEQDPTSPFFLQSSPIIKSQLQE